jgi:hypothetical protein
MRTGPRKKRRRGEIKIPLAWAVHAYMELPPEAAAHSLLCLRALEAATLSRGADFEQLVSEAEQLYGQAFYRQLAFQQQDLHAVSMPALSQASDSPEQVHVLHNPLSPQPPFHADFCPLSNHVVL